MDRELEQAKQLQAEMRETMHQLQVQMQAKERECLEQLSLQARTFLCSIYVTVLTTILMMLFVAGLGR